MNLPFFKALLQEHMAEVLADIDIGDRDTGTVELDQTRQGRLSRMDAMQRQAMAQETQRRRAIRVKRIDRAIRRIEDDEYGECLRCGEPIPEGRLKIDPAATHCVACAEQPPQR